MKRLPRSVDALRGLRAARWVRESTERQRERYGPEAQHAQQDEAIARWGLIDTGRVWQVAHSGRTIATTSQFAEMLATAGTEWDVLVVSYVSRFARDVRTAVNARHDLHLAGAVILFADETLLSSDEDRWEMYVQLTTEAEAYSRRLAKRVAEGYAAKFRTIGDQGGAAPLGFQRVGHDRRLAIDPETIAVPVSAFTMYATGTVSYAEVGEAIGVEAGSIREILRNPIYNGWVRRHRRSAAEERKPAPWRAAPPVSDDLWERVSELRTRRTRSSGPRATDRPRPLLSGLLRCSCETRIRSNGTRRGSAQLIHPGECERWGDHITTPTAPFEAAIARQLTGIELSDADVAGLVALLAAPPQVKRPSVDRRRRDLALAHADGRLTDDEYLASRRRLDRETEQPVVADAIDAADVVRWVRALPEAWAEASPEARRALVGVVYDRIVIEADRFVEVVPTAYAVARGLPALLPERVDGGTGEPGRVHMTTFHRPRIVIPVRGAREMRARLRSLRSA